MEPIAQRVLMYRDEDGEKEIPIRLFAPEACVICLSEVTQNISSTPPQ